MSAVAPTTTGPASARGSRAQTSDACIRNRVVAPRRGFRSSTVMLPSLCRPRMMHVSTRRSRASTTSAPFLSRVMVTVRSAAGRHVARCFDGAAASRPVELRPGGPRAQGRPHRACPTRCVAAARVPPAESPRGSVGTRGRLRSRRRRSYRRHQQRRPDVFKIQILAERHPGLSASASCPPGRGGGAPAQRAAGRPKRAAVLPWCFPRHRRGDAGLGPFGGNTVYSGVPVVQQGGLEPPTSGSTDRRSNQLSYCCTMSRCAGKLGAKV